MHKGFKFLALTLVVLGVVLAWMAFWVASPAKTPEAPLVTAPVQGLAAPTRMVVARKALPAGHLLQAEDVQWQEVAALPPGAVALETSVLGRTLTQPVAAGDMVLAAHLLGGMPGLLQPGERAVAIKVDESTAVGHKLAPGDWVDVLVVLRKDNQEVAATQAKQLLARKRVLAYGSQLEGVRQTGKEATGADEAVRTGQPPRTAVLAVQAQEVNALLLAERQGQVLLALRHPLDMGEPGGGTPGDAPWTAAGGPDAVVLTQLARVDTGGMSQRLLPSPSLVASQGGQPSVRKAVPSRPTGLAVEVIRGNRAEMVHY